jgi:hypothetical protein
VSNKLVWSECFPGGKASGTNLPILLYLDSQRPISLKRVTVLAYHGCFDATTLHCCMSTMARSYSASTTGASGSDDADAAGAVAFLAAFSARAALPAATRPFFSSHQFSPSSGLMYHA